MATHGPSDRPSPVGRRSSSRSAFDAVRPFGRGAAGPHVVDLQLRLSALGLDPGAADGDFGDDTARAVLEFQQGRGLDVDGICGPETWAALVESGYSLGDRLLVLQRPMLRGDDVADLQRRLGRLGFDPGRVDGIFGPATQTAVGEFQRNAGLVTDGIFGPDADRAMARLGTRTEGDVLLGQLRPSSPTRLVGARVVVAEDGGLAALAAATRRRLVDAGCRSLVVHHPSGSAQARQANRFDADLFVGLRSKAPQGVELCHYETSGFVSEDGRRLAAILADDLEGVFGAPAVCRGTRLPVLRETRMPAVLCRLTPMERVVAASADLADAITSAINAWCEVDRFP